MEKDDFWERARKDGKHLQSCSWRTGPEKRAIMGTLHTLKLSETSPTLADLSKGLMVAVACYGTQVGNL